MNLFGYKLIKTDGAELERLARSGKYMPLLFVIAARQVPGYDAEKAEHLENQYFDHKGFPALTPTER